MRDSLMTTMAIISLFGAVMLILYGMRLAGEGLQKVVGGRMRTFLMKATSNRFKGLGAGAAITAVLQSSSATTVMLVGFVGSGLLGLKETMGIILGADIGTTLTVQIIAFRVYDYSILLVGLGSLFNFLGRSGTSKETGRIIMGFGFIFLALQVLMRTFEPVAGNPLAKELLLGLSRDPIAGIIVSTLMTALLHSSAATLGLAITAAHSGLLTLDAAMPIVLGANIGTCVSAVTSSIGAPVDAKRVALAHILFKVLGVLLVLPFLGFFTTLVGMTTEDPSRQVAVAHTSFNIAIAFIFLPFTAPFTNLVKRMLPEKEAPEKFAPRYLDPHVLESPALALIQASREGLRAADIVGEMLKTSIEVFEKGGIEAVERIEEKDNDVDMLDREIKLYLTKISKESLSDEQSKRELEIILFSDNMENVGDVIDKNLMELARKKLRGDLSFSKAGMHEIKQLHQKVVENFDLGVAAFASSDAELARRLLAHKEKLSELERELRAAHIERLHRGLRESIDTSSIHLDVLTNLKRINSYISNVAYPILEREKE